MSDTDRDSAEELATKVWAALDEQGQLDQHPEASLTAQNLCTLPPPGTQSLGPAEVPLTRLRPLSLEGEEADFVPGDLLGKGGMGEVRLAVDPVLRREVALKSTPRGTPALASQALLEEALYTGFLEHPNVIPVHRLGADDRGRPVLVMKRVVGTSWQELIRDPDHAAWAALPGDRLRAHLEILIQVCNALHFAHSKGILHRDVKPANVMVGEYGEVYLVDWGLAVRLDRLAELPETVVGTLAYMAPEMLEAPRQISPRTDVYLAGASLHEVLAGSPRHTGSGHMNVMLSVIRSRPQTYGPEVPLELAEVVNRATAADPEARPATILEFRQLLELFLEHRGSIELAARAGERLAELEREHAQPRDPSGREAAALFAACRFGYEHALHVWPENQQAQQGLQRCLELTIERELAQGNAGLVETLLPTLPRQRPDLEARLAELRAELARQAEAPARLEELERQHDLTEAGRQRAALTWGLAVVGYGGVLWLAQHLDWGHGRLTYETAAGFGLLVMVLLLVNLAVGWRWLNATEVNRRLAMMIGAGWLACMLHVAVCWVYRFPPWVLITHLGVLMTAITMQLACAIDARLWGPAMIGVLGLFAWMFGLRIDPLLMHVLGGGLIMGWIAFIWIRDPPGSGRARLLPERVPVDAPGGDPPAS